MAIEIGMHRERTPKPCFLGGSNKYKVDFFHVFLFRVTNARYNNSGFPQYTSGINIIEGHLHLF